MSGTQKRSFDPYFEKIGLTGISQICLNFPEIVFDSAKLLKMVHLVGSAGLLNVLLSETESLVDSSSEQLEVFFQPTRFHQ